METPENPPLLATKLVRPHFNPSLVVSRQRLVERLVSDDTIKLVLFSAPAGCGKTTLVQEWLSRESSPVAWISLDKRDNDAVLFWRYLTAALTQAGILNAAHVSALLAVQSPPPLEEIIGLLVNDLVSSNVGRSNPVFLVLDDFQAIDSQAVHASLNYFLDYQPEFLHLVIATRSDPPINLPLLRARRAVLEIRIADLRFTPVEADELLNGILRLALTTLDVKSLCQRTEGWAAGLQLAAISLREVEDRSEFVNQFAGDDRYVADYLVGEVLQRRSPETQRFLLETSILERFNADLCEAVTGRSDSRQVLYQLEKENIFLISLDNRREWYRYHRLFADLLLERLLEQQNATYVAELYRKSSRWHIEKNDIEEAVEYALKSRDFELALDLLQQYGSEFFIGSQLTRLVALAGRIPWSWQEKKPRFLMMMAWALLATGEFNAVEPNLQAIEKALAIQNQVIPPFGSDLALTMDSVQLSALIEIAAVRTNLAINSFALDNILEWGQKVLPYLSSSGQTGLFNTPEELKGPVLFMMGLANKYLGFTQEAGSLFGQAVDDALKTKNNHIIALAMANLAETQILDGQLKNAENTCRKGLVQLQRMSTRVSPYAGGLENHLGQIAYERNELAVAEQYFNHGYAAGRLWRHWDTLLDSCAGLVTSLLARADFGAARQILVELVEFLEQNRALMMLPQANALQARLDLAIGNASRVKHWVEQAGLDQLEYIPFLMESWFLVYLHFLVSQKKWQSAAHKINLLQNQVKNAGRRQVSLQLLIYQAIVEVGLGEQVHARQTMGRALAQGESLGYFRLFLDVGKPAASLIYACLEHKQSSAYAAKLLAAYSQDDEPDLPAYGIPGSPPGDLIEPLTQREIEVLALLGDGLTNQEIGVRLSISLTTVKTHTRNLYAKLGVDSRSRAVARARTLGILSN